MKRVILFIAIVALAFACCFAGCSRSADFVSTVTEKLSPAIEKISPAIEKVKDLLPVSDAGQTAGTQDGTDGADGAEGSGGLSLPALDDISLGSGILSSTDDITLVPTDDYAAGYVFYYGGEEFIAYFDTDSWRVYDSYRITNHDDIVIICQALLNEHLVYGSDWVSYRTAEDMAYEWEQHNLAYKMLPADSHWRDDAKDVDLDPDDQGKSISEIYESRTGQPFDIRNYLPGE